MFLFDLADRPASGLAFLREVPPAAAPGGPGGRLARWIELMFQAQFADAAGDTAARDEAWEQAAAADPIAAAKAVALFRESLGEAPGKPFDAEAFNALLQSTAPVARSFLGYFAGRFLSRHGKYEGATAYLDQAARGIAGGSSFTPLLARNALRAVQRSNGRRRDRPDDDREQPSKTGAPPQP